MQFVSDCRSDVIESTLLYDETRSGIQDKLQWSHVDVRHSSSGVTLTAKKRDQRGLQNSDENKLVEILK